MPIAYPERDHGPLLLSQVLGAFSYALDLTEGQPPGHCVRSCWIGMHIGGRLGLADDAQRDLYYTLLLKDAGCSSNAVPTSRAGSASANASPARFARWTNTGMAGESRKGWSGRTSRSARG
jgi:hypothetical protein